MTKKVYRYFFFVTDPCLLQAEPGQTHTEASTQTWALQKSCYKELKVKGDLPSIGDSVAAFRSEAKKPLTENTRLTLFANGVIIKAPRHVQAVDRPILRFRFWFDFKVETEWQEQFLANELNIGTVQVQIPVLFKVEESLYIRIIGQPKLKTLEKRLSNFKGAQGLVWDSRLGHFATVQKHLEQLPDDDILAAVQLRLRQPQPKNFFTKIESIYLNEVSSAMQKLSPRDFERLCNRVVQKLGFKALLTRSSGDQGIDIIAEDWGQSFRGGRYIFQCKRTMNVGPEVIRSLVGTVETEKAIKGILLTTGVITNAARQEASANTRIELVDGLRLESIVKSIAAEAVSQ